MPWSVLFRLACLLLMSFLSSCSEPYVVIPVYGPNEMVEVIVDKELTIEQSELLMSKLILFADEKRTTRSAMPLNGKTYISIGPVKDPEVFRTKASKYKGFVSLNPLSGRRLLLQWDRYAGEGAGAGQETGK
ncbi:MAG: hypothetical protein WCO77_06955 [bacterium]